MNERERLIALLQSVPADYEGNRGVGTIADHLLSNGVVEVVRCRDCVYYASNCCFNRQWDFESSTEIPMVREDDFCSYGERKEQT